MSQPYQSSVAKYLPWVFVQGGLLLGWTFPNRSWAEPRWMLPVAVVLSGWVVYCLARNVGRLWSAPAREASAWTGGGLSLCGCLFALASVGPLMEGQHASTILLGAVHAVLSALLLVLAVRDLIRVQRRVSAPTG